jgi:hypothetical protein
MYLETKIGEPTGTLFALMRLVSLSLFGIVFYADFIMDEDCWRQL